MTAAIYRTALLLLTACTNSSGATAILADSFSGSDTDCDAAWSTSCVPGWVGIGGADTLAHTHVADAPDRLGVLIKGGSTDAPNGIARTYPLPAGASASAAQRIKVIAKGQGGELRARLTYRNAQGDELATASGLWTLLGDTSMTLGQRDVIPAGAATVEVKILVRGTSAMAFVEDWRWDGTVSGKSGSSATQEECDEKAREVEAEEKARCERAGGSWKGTGCKGFPHPTEDGCAFVCSDMCTRPADSVVVPSGF